MTLYNLDGVDVATPASGAFWVAPNAVLLGKVKLEEDASVWFGAVLRGDNELMRRFYPEAWDKEWHSRVVDYSCRVAFDSIRALRDAHAFVRTEDIRDAARVNAFTVSLARRVARADLAFVAECKALRRELEERVHTRAGRELEPEVGDELPVWAAETRRLGSSLGLEVSTELLPRPLSLTEARP